MKVRGIDPRDIESEMQAVYRVFVWSNLGDGATRSS